MKERRFVMTVAKDSTDELRVVKYLDEKGIKYASSEFGIYRKYIEFRTDKLTGKKIMKDLGFAVTAYYCKPKELF